MRRSISLATDGDAAVFPINVLQKEVADFSASQSKPSEQQQEASTEGLDDDMVAHLRNTFGDQVEFDDNAVKWKGNNDANQDDGSQRRDDDAGDNNPSRVGPDVRTIVEGFRSRDNGAPIPPGFSEEAGAEIAAVASGRKPLYHEAWGTDTSSDLIRRLWGLRLPGVKMLLEDGHLYVYSPESVAAVIAANPDAYPGVDLFDKIRRAIEADEAGDLLGYGAPTRLDPNRVRVQITDARGAAIFGFYSTPINADHYGFERALDFTQAYGETFGYDIIPSH